MPIANGLEKAMETRRKVKEYINKLEGVGAGGGGGGVVAPFSLKICIKCK